MNSTRLLEKALRIQAEADDAGRDLTGEERGEVSRLIADSKTAAEGERQVKRLDSVPSVASADPNATPGRFQGPGDRFVDSAAYKRIKDSSSRGQSWTTGLVDCGNPGMMTKGTLLEGSGAPGSGTGGGLVPVPQVVPGIVQTLFQPLTLEDLLQSGQATTSSVRYAVQGTATSGAAGVAEGGAKPESTLGFSTRDEPVKKIATSLSISDELLEDAPAVQTFINGQLTEFVRIESERQLLRGAAGGNEVQGILTSRGVPVYAGGTAAGSKAEQLFKALNGVRGSAFVEPEWIVLHPSDWQDLRLAKDTANQYYGGGPFLGSYGGPQGPVGPSGQLTGAADALWGKLAYVSSVVGAGTALVGSRAAATVWNRNGVSVEATNSHSDYFTKNLVALRAERRLALTLFRPDALVEVRLA